MTEPFKTQISGPDRHRQHVAGHHGGAVGFAHGRQTSLRGAAEIAVVLLENTMDLGVSRWKSPRILGVQG